MANILTAAEAAQFLRCETTDPLMLALLPSVDAHIELATGHNWASDSTINSIAKTAAGKYITMLHEGGWPSDGFERSFKSDLAQLEALAMRYRTFEGLSSAGLIYLPGAREGDTVSALIGIVGITGDQSSKFESVISENDYIQQTSSDNLDDKHFRVLITPLEAL